MDFDHYLSPSQAARQIGVSAASVRGWAKDGRLPSLVTPIGRLFHERDVEAKAAERRARAPEPGTAGDGRS